MDIIVVNLSVFTSTEYQGAKSISFSSTDNAYIITKSDGTTVKYNRNAVLIGFKP